MDTDTIVSPWPTFETPGERIRWVLQHLTDHPEHHEQGIWTDRDGDRQASVKARTRCESTGCVAGWGVTVTPFDQLPVGDDFFIRWDAAGRIALGLNTSTSAWLFDPDGRYDRVMRALSYLASMPDDVRLNFDPSEVFEDPYGWICDDDEFGGEIDELPETWVAE